MKKSIIYAISALIIMSVVSCFSEIECDVFSYEIPIITKRSFEDTNIWGCQFSKDTKRISITCNNGNPKIQFQDNTYHLFDLDSDQIKDITYYRTKSYDFFDHQIDPCYEWIIYMIPDLQEDGTPRRPGINFVIPQQPLGNPPPQPHIPSRSFKIFNLWEDSEIFLNRGSNTIPIDYFDVRFDNLKSEIWLRDKEPGLGHRYGYWQLYDNRGIPIQKYPNDLSGFTRCNILPGNPITSPDGSKVAFPVGSHYTLPAIGEKENDLCFIMVCDRKTGDYLAQIPVATPQTVIGHLPQNGMFSKDSRSLFVKDSPWQISLVDIETQQIEQMFNIRKIYPNCFHTICMQEVTPDGNLVIETISPSTLKSEIPRVIVWDGHSGKIIQTYDSDLSFMRHDRISPDARTFLSFDRFESEIDEATGQRKETKTTRQVTFKDIQTGEVLATLEVPANGSIMPVVISDDWSKMVGYGKEQLIVYDISGIINRP